MTSIWLGKALPPQVKGWGGPLLGMSPRPAAHLAPWRRKMRLVWLLLLHRTEVMKV